ncbi:MAG: N5-carboxyaminoimidazole ribonucleotide mutase [Candidatus Heimdallarchaeota archaeon LC_2]|nr:MAG: N5-carboxyaminoimidazole ribonucleotide mutase [Candidatus Heimdallarchaeota archaeon LC_2]
MTDIVNHDAHRKSITGIPECVLAEPKTNDQLTQSIIKAVEKNNNVAVTRLSENQALFIDKFCSKYNHDIIFDKYRRTAIIGSYKQNLHSENLIAIVSAGTSDNYIVTEVTFLLRYFGYDAETFSDVGVAGIHRHREALDKIENNSMIKLIIIVAGQEGALFSVISAQTKLPVVSIPTSIGYGFGGKGITALQSALQSCSPGITVLNIDNGFGGAAFAAKLLNLFE